MMNDQDSGRLAGKVAFISGTAGGQGRAAARLFAREGARVFGCDRDETGAAETVQMVREAGGEMASLHPIDLVEEGTAERWIEAGLERFGRIDILYNNAGTARFAAVGEASARGAWAHTIRGELDLPYLCIEAAWPHLIAAGTASIVNIASTAALGGRAIGIDQPGSSAAHAASKAGVVGMTRQVAAEGARHRIRVNAILPGFVEAPVTASALVDPRARQRIAERNPLGRWGQPEDVAYAALYLASDEASWVTGETLVVDGGMAHATGGYGDVKRS